ncbi:MAG: glycosyltransferase family 4 protein [Nitrospinae bacterium]|nr:glycosyltransferase family 4 protein [Nitrospinota bacterium]
MSRRESFPVSCRIPGAPVKIAIDVRTINKPRSGVGYYVTNLVEQLQVIDRTNAYCLLSNDPGFDAALAGSPNFNHCHTRVSNENHLVGDLWENTYLPHSLMNRGIDVFHGPAFMIPLYKGELKTVATIHDIVAYVLPRTIPMKYALYMKLLIGQVVKRADRLISVSESTKRDMVRWLGVPEGKISVVPQGVGKDFVPAPPDDEGGRLVRKKFGIRGDYFLFVGNLEPRKNLIRIMQAFEIAREKAGRDLQLVICGKKGWLYDDILAAYHRIRRDSEIVLTNYVDEADRLRLYQHARTFLFPTLYEGFGMPVLEAMACGAPVITSNVSSFPEICGDAALLVDPYDVQGIADAILSLEESPDLRASLRAKGLERAALYTWRETAARTLDVYRSVM